jgi:hypothetical protein
MALEPARTVEVDMTTVEVRAYLTLWRLRFPPSGTHLECRIRETPSGRVARIYLDGTIYRSVVDGHSAMNAGTPEAMATLTDLGNTLRSQGWVDARTAKVH